MLGPKATGAEEAAQREHKEDTKEGESKPCPEPIRPKERGYEVFVGNPNCTYFRLCRTNKRKGGTKLQPLQHF